jgi:uroporphyrinogen decarboxylase
MIIRGEKPDRPAVSLWRHFYDQESTPEGLAKAMLDYQDKYDWDFIKINPRSSYHVEDWGVELEWSKDPLKKHRKVKFAVAKVNDWDKIESLSSQAPVLKEHLKAIRIIRKESGKSLPLFMTVFNPLSIAGYLVKDRSLLQKHLRESPARVLPALENITATFEKYVGEIRDAGADGIFFATTQWASANLLTWDEYRKYARPFDMRVLKAGGVDSLNILHICDSNNYLEEMADYPVAMFNWDSCHPTNFPLEKGFEILKSKVVIGGIDHTGWLRYGTPGEIKNEITGIKEQMEGKRFIFGPGCTYEPTVPEKNIAAIRKGVMN